MNTEQKCCQKCQGIRNGYLQLVPKIEHRSAFFCKSPKCECHHTEQKWWREEFERVFFDAPISTTTSEISAYKSRIQSFIERTLQEQTEELVQNIVMLRQWLNEDRIQDPKKMVTNEDLKHWLIKDKI